MRRLLSVLPVLAAVAAPLAAQNRASVDQVRTPAPPRAAVRVAPIDPTRSSATVQRDTPDKTAASLTPAQVAACRDARARGRPAPDGVACVAAPPVAPPKPRAVGPTAETSLLGMLGQSFDTGAGAPGDAAPDSADQVARELSTGTFQGSAISDAAASVARDRAATPPPPPPQGR